MPKYISPSSLSKWESNRSEFYSMYLCEHRNPRPLQEVYMAVGSGLDAFVKSQIYSDVFGPSQLKGSQFEFTTIFESQVEAHCRDEVMTRAADLWKQYNESGAYGALLADIVQSPFPPQMEFTSAAEVQGVPLSGKPDLRYVTKEHVHVLADWKVNGSTSVHGASPEQGFKIARNTYDAKKNGEVHKKFEPMQFKDVVCNARYLDEFCDYWADQLAIYAWTMGEEVGSEEFVTRMEQVACRPVKDQPLPRAKFATHVSRISKRHQELLISRIHDCWNTIKSGHIFTDMSREESDERCEMLDMVAQTPKNLNPVLAGYANETTRFKG